MLKKELKNLLTMNRRKELGIDKHKYFGFGDNPDPFDYDLKNLRRVSFPTSMKEITQMNLVARLKRAQEHAWIQGYGVAAIQIGVPVQAAWYMLPKDGDWKTPVKTVLLWNPEIVEVKGFKCMPNEGCLSIPQKSFITRRYKTIVVKNGDGTLIHGEGIEAIILQHEIGHMAGQLCTDFKAGKEMLEIGRNDKCPCGATNEEGTVNKFKNCCQD